MSTNSFRLSDEYDYKQPLSLSAQTKKCGAKQKEPYKKTALFCIELCYFYIFS